MFARSFLSAAIIGIAAMALAATSVAAEDKPGSGTRTITINAPGDGPASERIVLGLNKSVVVNLPRDAADVMVSNPEIVDAVIRTPRRIYLLGRGIGEGMGGAEEIGREAHQVEFGGSDQGRGAIRPEWV